MTMTRSILSLPASLKAVRRIGPWLSSELEPIGAGHLIERLGELELAVHELAVNVIDHAYRGRAGEYTDEEKLEFSMWVEGERLYLRSVDSGTAFEEADRPQVTAEPTVHGYGLFIVEQLAESITYERVDDCNHWTLLF